MQTYMTFQFHIHYMYFLQTTHNNKNI